MGFWLARLIVRFFFRLIAPVVVIGMENVPTSGAYIAVSNHLGRLDPFLVFYLLDRRDVTVLLAEKYQKYALARWMARVVDAVWVDRFNADFGVLRLSLNRLKEGGALVIAPEGTRSQPGVLAEGRPGSSYLAAKSGVPVIPVALTGTWDKEVLKKLKHLRRPHITVRVGKPFTLPPIKGGDRDELMQRYTEEMMCRIAVLLPPEYRGAYAEHPRLKALLGERRIEPQVVS